MITERSALYVQDLLGLGRICSGDGQRTGSAFQPKKDSFYNKLHNGSHGRRDKTIKMYLKS